MAGIKNKQPFFAIALCLLAMPGLYAQQKHALVIGNSAYSSITRLNNPVNDARDMEATLKSLGWNVEILLNGNLERMEGAVTRLKSRLSGAGGAYGLFFYAGHGVQSGGENYLIPVDANIQSENYLKSKALPVSVMLDELNDARNALNIVILDACRDNPFSWNRSGSRGLSLVANQPADSIIVYATGAGGTAADGSGRNGLFTRHLLSNLKIPGLEVNEVFRRTMGDVARDSGNRQHPAIYNQFPGVAYMGTPPAVAAPPPATAVPRKTAQTHLQQGIVFLDQKDYEMAIRESTEAIRLDPNFADAYNLRGDAYRAKGDHDRAIADITQAIRLDPNFTDAYFNRGIAYQVKGDHDRAIADYTQAIRLDPNAAIAYRNRGNAWKAKGDAAKAEADYAKARQLQNRP